MLGHTRCRSAMANTYHHRFSHKLMYPDCLANSFKQATKWPPKICFSSYILLKCWFQKIILMIRTNGKVVKVSNVCSELCSRSQNSNVVHIFNHYQNCRQRQSLKEVSCTLFIVIYAHCCVLDISIKRR